MQHVLTVEISADGVEVDIHADREGLRILQVSLEQLRAQLDAGRADHVHLMTPDWGGSELSTAVQNNTSRLAHHLQVHGWPVGAAAATGTTSVKPWEAAESSLGCAGSVALVALSHDHRGLRLSLARADDAEEVVVAVLRFHSVATYQVTDETWCSLREELSSTQGDATVYELAESDLLRAVAKGGRGVPAAHFRHWLVLTDNEWIDVIAGDATFEPASTTGAA